VFTQWCLLGYLLGICLSIDPSICPSVWRKIDRELTESKQGWQDQKLIEKYRKAENVANYEQKI
jgi:hypothetical protein